MMQLKDLCLALVHCETEDEIIEILKREKYWDRPENWQLFGDDENNYSIIGNQQNKPESAIVEKIINSVDAMLMGECLRQDINPESQDAPQSIKDALVKYYQIFDGKLTNISPKERSKLAENIGFVATGQKTNPNYAIFDSGEGQSPARLHSTILSIRKSNKLRIPFVQGKFNMGGTGVFRFCGERNIQLIISKRHPGIAEYESDPMKDFWGFTIIRRDDPQHGARSSNYKYLAPSNHILFFPADELLILPGDYPEPYCKPMQWGTYIKLFEYKIGPGLRTIVNFDLYNKLSVLMPSIALPVKLYERRKNYSAHTYETILSGLSVRVDEDRSENIEDNFPTSGSMTVSGQQMKYSIYVFKKGKHEKFTKDEGIVFTINGQTHGYISKPFFNRKGVGLSYLAESILVILDCSDIDGRAREDLFMNSRDRLSTCPLKTEIENELEDVLKKHPGLGILKDKRRREEIETKLSDQQPLTEVLQNLLKNSPTLSKLFVQGLKLINPFNTNNAGKSEEYNGRDFPTIFTLTKKFNHENPKQAHQNSKFRVEFNTDVANDYFDRSKDPGTFKLFVNGKESENRDINLWNGNAYLNVLLENSKVGDLVHFRSEVNDISRAAPFTEEFYIKVIEPLNKQQSKGGKRKPPASNQPGDETKKPDGFALPNIIEVPRENWTTQGFNENSALKVKDSGELGYDYFVNIDNIHLLSELKAAKNTEIRAIQAKYKFGLVLIGLALINDNDKEQKTDDTDDSENIFTTIEKITKAISPVIIPMIDTLGALEMQDLIASMPEE
ncbi:MAG: hypothetical protein HY960_03085 [Ignavibacteriae bacterium]|nr:hypothetical protein [Ignavibacteriota bacterium]